MIARLLSAVERIDALERLGEAASVPDPAAELQRLDLLARLERLEQGRLESAAGAEVKLTAALAEAAAARAEVNARMAELQASGGAGRRGCAHVAGGRARAPARRARRATPSARDREREDAEAARGELRATLDRVEREHDRELEAARAELAAALERIEAVQREAERLSERIGAVTIDRHEGEALAGDDRRAPRGAPARGRAGAREARRAAHARRRAARGLRPRRRVRQRAASRARRAAQLGDRLARGGRRTATTSWRWRASRTAANWRRPAPSSRH